MAAPSPSREGTSVWSTSLRGFVAGRMCGSSTICKGSRNQHDGCGQPGSSNGETLFVGTFSTGERRISSPKVGWPTQSVACPPARKCRTRRTRVYNQ
jgi:hypothetical protein